MRRLNVFTLFGMVLIILAIIGFIVHMMKEPETLNKNSKGEPLLTIAEYMQDE